MGQIATRTFISDGNAANIDIGFIPAYAKILNANAAVNEIVAMEYFNLGGDAKEFAKYIINDQGTTTALDVVKQTGSGYISEYDTVAVMENRVCTFDYTGGAAEDLFTCGNAQDEPINGDVIKFVESGGLATGLSETTTYYAIDCGTYGAGTFRVSTTSPQKGAQSRVEFTSDGTPTNYFKNLSKGEPVVYGGKGITISGSFMDDGDVIFIYAVEADTDQNLGDAASW